MSVATEFPPDVHIPAGARTRVLRSVDGAAGARLPRSFDDSAAPAVRSLHQDVSAPAAPADAALGAGVIDLDRWRHHDVGAQVGGRRRIVADLRIRPSVESVPSSPLTAVTPIRLTRRGIVALAVASVLLSVAVVLIAWVSASSGSAGSVGSVGSARSVGVGADGPAVITVHNGDSLWSIATQVAPNRDPRAMVDDLSKLNHLSGDSVTPGQQLRVR